MTCTLFQRLEGPNNGGTLLTAVGLLLLDAPLDKPSGLVRIMVASSRHKKFRMLSGISIGV